MPQRRHDANAKWFYPARYPGQDLRMAANATTPGMLVESVGTDGRFEGAVRTFPGFGAESVHGVPAPEAGVTTIENIDNLEFVKYVAIRKGTTPHSLKGLMMIGDNQAGTGKAIYFAYRDSETDTSDVVLVEDFRAWTDFRPDTFEDYDITSLGRYAYFVNSGDIVTDVPSFQNKEAPYNKAYFWDFKVNDWDKYVGGIVGRIAGCLPERCLATVLNGPADGVLDEGNEAYDTDLSGETSGLPAGEYTHAAELISRKHKIRSFLRWSTEFLLDPGSCLRWLLNRTRLPDDGAGETNQLRGNAQSLTAPIHWGIGHVDGFRLWRSPRNDTGSGQVSGDYQLSQHLYVQEGYWEKGAYTDGSSIETWDLRHSSGVGGTPPFDDAVPVMTDDALLTQEQYDAVFHEVGAMPRLKRLVGFDGMLIGVTDPREPATPDESWSDAERLPEAICWSAIHNGETENFPLLNYEELDSPAERVLELYAGSSAAFATTNMGIYRIVRAGGSLNIVRVAYPLGVISRHGACVVGDVLYVVTRSGIKEIDGLTGEVRNVRQLNRLVIDDKRWAGSLDAVHVGYDSFAGCIVLLNTTRQEMVLFWESTAAVTRIIDAPWTFLASGPDVLTNDGGQRAYLVDADGKSHTIDAYREAGKVTMFGGGASDTVNGSVTSAGSSLVDSAAAFSAGCVGFKAYILSGDLAGESATITARTSATELAISGLSDDLAVGDRYSIAPVVVQLRFPRLSGLGHDDPFVRKLAANMMAALQELQGETTTSDPNAFLYAGLHSGASSLVEGTVAMSSVPDKVVVTTNVGRASLYPYLATYGSNMDYEVDALLVQGDLPPSEASSRQG